MAETDLKLKFPGLYILVMKLKTGVTELLTVIFHTVNE